MGRELELYKKLNDNIRVSERLRSEISKSIKNGADLSDILLTTLECIGLMTGDKLFLKQNKRALEQKT